MPTATDSSREELALFGKDPLPRIVDVQPLLRGAHSDQAGARIYQRSSDFSEITVTDEPFYPFFFISDVKLLRDLPRRRFRCRQLGGDNFFRYVVAFQNWGDYWDGVRQVERHSETQGGPPEELYRIGSPVQQYLMQTGRTCFMNMHLADLHRLQLDIEVRSDGEFPNADRPADEVIIVALSDNRGWQQILHQRRQSERDLLEQLTGVIQDRDPDVIEGHNLFQFDLAYLRTRYDYRNVPFALGRDGSPPRSFSSSMRFAERTVDFPALKVAGRHIIDTYFQVMAYDVFKRDLPGYGLKDAARYFGFAPKERTYVEGDEITRVWDENPELLLAYAADDVTETERLARHLSGSDFYLSQMVPMPYGQAARTGPAAKIEALFVREYLRRQESFPRSTWGSQRSGGYTDIFVTGVLGPIVYADVESLYPSIMLNYDVQPEGDSLALFPHLLGRLTELRFEAKRGMKNADTDDERGELDARQSSYKVLINSFYGLLGFSLAVFNDFDEADRVTRTGQKILRRMIRAIQDKGGRVIEADTDGVFFVPPDDVRGEDAEIAFTKALTGELPEGIRVGFDGRYHKMLSYKKKNYALLQHNGGLKFKGSSLISRSNEAFGRRFTRQAVRLLLDEDVAGLHDLYMETRACIEDHDWRDGARSFCRTETLKDTIQHYEQDVESGKRPRAAAYELAKHHTERTGQPARKGDRISYYLTGQNANVTAFRNCARADDWDAEDPDENTAYYLKRLREFTRKFEPFFTEADFRLVFSPEDLFGFDADGIEIQSHQHEATDAAEEHEDEIPF